MKLSKQLTGLIFASALPTLCAAQSQLTMNGFVTAGVGITDSEYDVAGTNDRPNFADASRFGLQFDFDPQLEVPVTFTAQFLARGRNNWEVEAEWAYVSYQATDEIQIKAGRIRMPVFMYSQTYDVGVTYPWILPPEEVYGFANIPFTSVTGISFDHSMYLGDWELGTTLYAGNNEFQVPVLGLDVDVDLIWGGGLVFNITNDVISARVSHHIMSFDSPITTSLKLSSAGIFLETAFPGVPLDLILAGAGITDTINGNVDLTTVGFGYDSSNIIAQAEWSFRNLDNTIFPDLKAAYIMLGYRMGKLTPHVTYAEVTSSHSLINQDQDSVTVGLSYQLTPASAIKLDYTHTTIGSGTALYDVLPAGFGGPTDLDDYNKIAAAYTMVF